MSVVLAPPFSTSQLILLYVHPVRLKTFNLWDMFLRFFAGSLTVTTKWLENGSILNLILILRRLQLAP